MPLARSEPARELILTGGFNVYSAEVEQVLLAHPAVQDCAVIHVTPAGGVERHHVHIRSGDVGVRGRPRARSRPSSCARGIGPHAGVLELPGYFLEALLLEVVFKETPVATRCVHRGL